MKKTIVVFVRDHSGSMRSIAHAAGRDYNSSIENLKQVTLAEGQDTIVSVVKCGHGDRAIAHREIVHSSVSVLKPLVKYEADAGGTPLFASVREAIAVAKATPDYDNPDVSFLINVTTDGQETVNRHDGPAVGQLIKQLQATDRWTFSFRVPRGDKRNLVSLGIPEGNIMEWDQSEKGMAAAEQQSKEAFTKYIQGRSLGVRSTGTFYGDLSNVTSKDVETACEEISKDVLLWTVAKGEDGFEIRPFVEGRLAGEPLLKGSAFYQLTKTEAKVQDYKKIVLRDKKTKAIFGGDGARQMLGLPSYGDVRLAPKDLGQFDVFIQSTSVNRKVPAGSEVLYWKAIGVPFTEGPSAR